MPSPNIPQGNLNKLRGSVVIPSFPTLNVTAPFLGPAGIGISFDGDATVFLPTLTGAVTSPEPYLVAMIRINLLKPQRLADEYKRRMELNTDLGNITVRPDVSSGIGLYQFINCAIKNVADLSFAGNAAEYPVSIQGYYNINSALWDGA